MWNYLLNLEKVEVKLLQEPYILYRSEVGISNNKNHSVRSRFECDLKIIDRHIHTDKSQYPKLINPYKFRYKFEREAIKYYWEKHTEVLKRFSNTISMEEIDAEKYLSGILLNANEWRNKYLSEK